MKKSQYRQSFLYVQYSCGTLSPFSLLLRGLITRDHVCSRCMFARYPHDISGTGECYRIMALNCLTFSVTDQYN
jgi:hypothetical protein